MITCPKCSTENRDMARFCVKCGEPLQQAAPVESPAPSTPPQETTSAAEPTPPVQEPAAASQPPPDELEIPFLPTKPLAVPEFAPLPPGELLGEQGDERRYEIMSVLSKGPKLNAYQVRDRRRRRCPQCAAAVDLSDTEFCANCGRAFAGEPIDHPIYLLRETADPQMLVGQSRIARLGLQHEGLVNLYHAFEHRPYGTQRRQYLVSDADEGMATLSPPQPEEQVLTWGKQLAQALAFLHSHNVWHRRVQLDNIRLVNSQAKLTNFSVAVELPPSTPKEEWCPEEVKNLARALRGLLGDQPLSPAAAAIFDKALSDKPGEPYATAEALAVDFEKALALLGRPTNVTLIVGRRSDVGKQRKLNEDSLLTLEMERVLQSESKALGLYAVADGMGGHSAGEIASAMVVRVLAQALLSNVLLPAAKENGNSELDYAALLQAACADANQAVHELAQKQRSDMGSTLVAALLVGSEAHIINVGDSRAYQVSQQGIKQITTDHSLVERLVAMGQVTREEARTHPNRNVIYRTIGADAHVDIDIFHESLKPGDRLLLCSDGLSGMVEDDQIQQTVLNSLHPQEACEELVRLANLAGGTDNITVVVIQVVEIEAPKAPEETVQ